jgi:hypothetical protein
MRLWGMGTSFWVCITRLRQAKVAGAKQRATRMAALRAQYRLAVGASNVLPNLWKRKLLWKHTIHK